MFYYLQNSNKQLIDGVRTSKIKVIYDCLLLKYQKMMFSFYN